MDIQVIKTSAQWQLGHQYPQATKVQRPLDAREVAMSETRCHICGSTDFEERLVEYIDRRHGNYLVVRDVPCEVCLHCGERYYGGSVLLQIERRFKEIYERHAKPQSAIEVPVEVYA